MTLDIKQKVKEALQKQGAIASDEEIAEAIALLNRVKRTSARQKFGALKDQVVTHIDGDRYNNDISNLRIVERD